MRLLRSLKLLLTANDDGSGIKHFDDQDAVALTVTDDTVIKKKNTGDLEIAASGTKAIPKGDVTTAGFLLIETDQELDLVFNSGSDTLKLKPSSAGSKAVLYWEGVITDIQATNVSATAVANVTYALIGV